MLTTIRKLVKVGKDGNVTVPVGVEEAGREVEVVISSPTNARPAKTARDMTPEEHKAFIESIAGKWEGDFPLPDDPPPEPRDIF